MPYYETHISFSLFKIIHLIKNIYKHLFDNSLPSNMRTKKGYSLLESIIAIVVLGILASIALPNFTVSIEKTRASEGVKILSSLLTAQRAFFAENQAYAPDLDDLDITISIPNNFIALSDASVDSDPNAVAQVVRSSGAYTLSIDKDGNITCTDGGGTICKKLGY